MLKRNSILYRAATLALSLVTALSSCGGLTTQAVVQQFDGKSLFMGVFFGEGEVGKRLPEVWNGKGAIERSTPEMVQQVKRNEDRIIQKIEQADPSFFKTFQRELSSGNPLKVEAALNAGAVRLQNALMVKTREKLVIDPELGSILFENKNIAVDSNLVAVSDVVLVTEVAGFELVAAVIAAVAVLVLVIGVAPESMERGKNQSLQHDVFVNLMTTRFAAVP
jgi:SdpC family antimicrobial peptide